MTRRLDVASGDGAARRPAGAGDERRRPWRRSDAEPPIDLLLVCSTGGHLQQLLALRPAWDGFERLWVTFDKSDARSCLRGEQAVVAHGPTNRSVVNLLRNLHLAISVVRRTRPRAMITTGAGVAVPFAWVCRLFGSRVVYVESFTRIVDVSLSGRLIAPVAHRTYVQWPEVAGALGGARYVGSVFSDP